MNRKGESLTQPHSIFSDCFAAMAFGVLHQIEPREQFAEIAKTTFDTILERQEKPKGIYNKLVPGTRDLQNFALPMILCNSALELEPLLGSQKVGQLTQHVTDKIMNEFYHEESGLILENVSAKGDFVDSFEGRLLNPGYTIEAMWLIIDLGIRRNDTDLIAKAERIMYRQLKHGWDEKYGGIFYFIDFKGHP